MSRGGSQALVWMLLVVLLAGCGRANVVRRETGSQPPRTSSQPVARTPSSGAAEAVVARGETLYGIAFRHGLDYREVARWNGIAAPYTIYPGQRIRLRPPAGAGRVAAQTPPAPSTPRTATPATSATTRAPASTVATQPSTPPPASTSTAAPATAPPAAAATVASSGPVAWRWPADGQIVGRFASGEPTRQGVDIAGQSGQEVRAAADGVVVYSGSGLVGYGELIIIKHTDEWLSAYGHNRRRLVEEGQSVRGGQQIAEMGRSGASRDMLHFEIRRNGRPVDPLQHLPRR